MTGLRYTPSQPASLRTVSCQLGRGGEERGTRSQAKLGRTGRAKQSSPCTLLSVWVPLSLVVPPAGFGWPGSARLGASPPSMQLRRRDVTSGDREGRSRPSIIGIQQGSWVGGCATSARERKIKIARWRDGSPPGCVERRHVSGQGASQ